MYTPNKHPQVNNVSDTYLWHCRLCHMNKNRMDMLIKERIFDIDDCESLSTCKSYLLDKMTKSSLKEKDE